MDVGRAAVTGAAPETSRRKNAGGAASSTVRRHDPERGRGKRISQTPGTASTDPVKTTHNLLTDSCTGDVQIIEEAIGRCGAGGAVPMIAKSHSSKSFATTTFTSTSPTSTQPGRYLDGRDPRPCGLGSSTIARSVTFSRTKTVLIRLDTVHHGGHVGGTRVISILAAEAAS
jgi:hypothetical protein